MEGSELGGPSHGAGGVQIEVEGREGVGAVLGEELYAQGITQKGVWEGDDFMGVKGVKVVGDDGGDTGRSLGKTAILARKTFG